MLFSLTTRGKGGGDLNWKVKVSASGEGVGEGRKMKYLTGPPVVLWQERTEVVQSKK